MTQRPPYGITTDILSRVAEIAEAVGRAEAGGLSQNPRLRRINRIRTIQGSLAIEGNILTEEQISTILDGKPVVAPLRDVQEARNAIKAYDRYERWDPASEADLLGAHEVLMTGLVDAPGHYRRGSVAVMGQDRVHHVGPPAARVPSLMAELLAWLGGTDEHPLIASSVFHYEFEFIHPFEDGNGRMGRLWQTLILTRWKPLFAHVPVESLVRSMHAALTAGIGGGAARSRASSSRRPDRCRLSGLIDHRKTRRRRGARAGERGRDSPGRQRRDGEVDDPPVVSPARDENGGCPVVLR